MPDKLHDLAVKLLQEHSKPQDAASALSAAARTDAKLRLALAAAYIGHITERQKGAKLHSRRRTGQHRKPGMPSAAQKRSNLEAERDLTAAIFLHRIRSGKRVGYIPYIRLRNYGNQHAETAVRFLDRGFDDAADAILLHALADHTTPVDPETLVKDCFKPATVIDLHRRSRIKAAQLISTGSARIAADLIAAARELPEIEEHAS